MKEIDFLILYEHKNREFESIALLKHELVRRGYTVEFFGFEEYHNKKKRKRLFGNVRIAVMPSLYKDENILTFVYGVAGKVKNIVNLRWEQIFTKKTENNLDYFVYPKENAKFAYHCCWGERPLEMLLKGGVKRDNLFVTGPIQMDFVRKIFEGYYFSKKELFERYNINQEKKSILFTSSFVSSSWNKWELDWLFSQYDENEKKEVKKSIEKQIISRNTILEWIIQLANEKDCTIIYRPHPAEAKTDIVDKLNSNKNIKVISDYNIKQWILTCDQVYTWNSTSLAEASVAGVGCAVLRPVEFDSCDEYSIYEEIPYITTYQQLNECYEDDFADSSAKFVNNKKLNTYLSIDPDKPSFIRTADALEEALKDDYYFPWDNFLDEELNSVKNKLFKNNLKDYMAQIIVGSFNNTRFIKRVLWRVCSGLCYRYEEIKKSKTPPITDEEFIQMEERIATVLSKN